MTWIVILTLITTSGASITMAPFVGEAACHSAGKAWVAQNQSSLRTTNYLCVKQ
jgi:hypothetical protein